MLKNRAALPRLDYLITFQIAAELESFAATAKELNVSETAVSRKMKLLEQHFQCCIVRARPSLGSTDGTGPQIAARHHPCAQQPGGHLRRDDDRTRPGNGSHGGNQLCCLLVADAAAAQVPSGQPKHQHFAGLKRPRTPNA